MLEKSFIHIPGINLKKEKILWLNNILHWNDYLKNHNKSQINIENSELIRNHIKTSIIAYQGNNITYFLKNLPNNQHWRIYNNFKCCFLDIETTGLSRKNNEITMVGIYNGQKSKVFINGINMDKLEEELSKYDTLITFNGKCFDVPFMKEKFPNLNLNKFHIDLRYVMKELGYSGGLKKIEKDLDIYRDKEIGDITGFEAVKLWYRYQEGDKSSLGKLVKYNIADVENLKIMMDFAFKEMKKKYFS